MQFRLSHTLRAAALVAMTGLMALPAPAIAQAQPERIEVKRGNSWYPATVLKREGARVQVHYEGLSDDFDEWVGPERIREAAVSPVKPANPSPAERKPGPALAQPPPSAKPAQQPAGEEESAAPAPTDGSEPKIIPTDLSGVAARTLNLNAATGKWSLKADAPAGTPAKIATHLIALFLDAERPGRPSRSFWEQIEDPIFAAPAATRAIMAHVGNPPGKKGFALRLETLDLAVGRSAKITEMLPNTKPIDLSPDGTQVLLRNEEWGDANTTRVDVASIGGPKTQYVASWKPYHDGDTWTCHVEWARFVDNTHVLTLNSKSVLALWELPKVTPVYALDLAGHTVAVMSPGRKYVVASSNSALCVFEAMTGKLLAVQPNESFGIPKLAVSPDGRQVAATYFGQVRVWDFETGKRLHSFLLPPGHFAGDMEWLVDDYILLDHHYLLDLSRQIILWEYTPGRGLLAKGRAHAGRYWYIAEGLKPGSRVLASAVLPHPAAKKVADGLDPEELLAVKPGVSVSLEVNIDFPDDARERVVKALESKLKANGLTVADGQPIKLTATSAPGESRKMQYHGFGIIGFATLDVTEVRLRVAFEMDGKAIWESVGGCGAPMMLSLKQGQTIEQAIADEKANGWQFFERAEIPKQVPRLPEKLAYGASELTVRGPQEAAAEQPPGSGDGRSPSPAGGRLSAPGRPRRGR